jgi:hypothetical protein
LQSRWYTTLFRKIWLEKCKVGRISYQSIQVMCCVISREFRKNGQIWVKVFTNIPITNKSTKTWMGKGKGNSKSWIVHVVKGQCRNPSFGLTTKAKGLQGCGPKGRKLGNQGKGITRLRAKRKPRSQGKGITKLRTKRKLGSHITYSRECKKVWGSVREWTLTLPRQLSLWEMESRWIPKTSESDLRGQNSMACGVLYIIGKLLERRCLKWARIAHLDIWNVRYGQKKGRELAVTYRWKSLDESYNFALDRTSIRGLLAKLWGSKIARVPASGISGLPLGSPGR